MQLEKVLQEVFFLYHLFFLQLHMKKHEVFAHCVVLTVHPLSIRCASMGGNQLEKEENPHL